MDHPKRLGAFGPVSCKRFPLRDCVWFFVGSSVEHPSLGLQRRKVGAIRRAHQIGKMLLCLFLLFDFVKDYVPVWWLLGIMHELLQTHFYYPLVDKIL